MGDWSWPGQRAAAAIEALPPAWVPAFPPRREYAAPAPAPVHGWRRTLLALALGGLLVLGALLATRGPLALERDIGLAAPAATLPRVEAVGVSAPAPPLPTLTRQSSDSAGSAIDVSHFSSAALHREGSFYVYLPAGYAATATRYPVLYLLHGNSQPATAFLELGLQEELDQLIARHVIPPLIAVMIQGGPGANNWRNIGGVNYESYVVEVQQLIDRALPTIAARDARAIAGDSMGGFGAMNVALGNPLRFGIVESWLGFFNGLEGELRADRNTIARLGLHAYVYGGQDDKIANPSENGPFAAALRAAGATAHSAVFPGGHSMETLQAHLGTMLAYAGRALDSGAFVAAR